MSCFCQSLGSCLSCFFCDCLCCECNCIIFPAPRFPQAGNSALDHENETTTRVQSHSFVTGNGKEIPYVEVSTMESRKRKDCFIYFHGNAQDITIVGMFLEPLVEDLNITFYAIEYPHYSSYSVCCPALISNTIKEDSLQFYDYLLRTGKTAKDIHVMGRSIGSGGASYLAGHRNIPRLILMSPFDTIKKVAVGMVGCLGCLIKQHFNNEEEIVNFTGDLLVIHGQVDEVIAVHHGKNLVKTYQQGNAYKNIATKVYPRRMSHNNFDLEEDIIRPIQDFLKK